MIFKIVNSKLIKNMFSSLLKFYRILKLEGCLLRKLQKTKFTGKITKKLLYKLSKALVFRCN